MIANKVLITSKLKNRQIDRQTDIKTEFVGSSKNPTLPTGNAQLPGTLSLLCTWGGCHEGLIVDDLNKSKIKLQNFHK